ncbi:nicotinamide N-methyltransferase-like [Scyliorhinus canicula]|uniref:nicotinamide N-methyltransferase-like n=1 Tax=Scyliorhinus canicula TaxID=7830 RepID=UPI0018F7B2F5|nr:nicotinamide N-methyltransferase-like [Scyliorhinus canicula]
MEISFSDGNYYEEKFDSRVFLETYFNSTSGHRQENEFLTFSLKNLVNVFSNGPKFRRLLEIGSGPCLHFALCASGHAEEIVLSDFVRSNCQEIKLWLKNDPGAFDWSHFAKLVCELEGNREKWTEKEKKLRDSVKQVLKCDVNQTNPLDPVELEPVDCLMTSLCLEVACKDKAAYCAALRNVTALLKPGGVLIMNGVLNQTFYTVNNHKFSCVKFDQAFLRKIVKEVGYEIEQLEIFDGLDKSQNTLSDFNAIFFLVALKNKNAPC